MKSYTIGRNLAGVLTKNASTANLSFLDEIANDDYRMICTMRDWPFLERLRTLTTVASAQFYNLPYDCEKVREVSVIVSSNRYTPKLCPDRKFWDNLNLSSFTSDTPEWYFIFNGQVGLWPTPASTGNTINITQKCRVIDLNVADYTTGTIVSVANGGVAVVGSGTSWTERMAGRYIRMTYSNTANTGDGVWYEISGVTDATHLTLVRTYGGTAIAAGSATFNIGQMPLLPESFHALPWYKAAAAYWAKEDEDRAASFEMMHDKMLSELKNSWLSPTTDMIIDDGDDNAIINPNLVISL
jgi:hypothetical protein